MLPSRSNRRTLERRRAEKAGRFAETFAAIFLRAKGYRLVARRFKAPVGEIDLIVRRGRTLVFVEVKQRSGPMGLDMALGAVGQERITRAAQWFFARNGQYNGLDCRFDVIVLAPWRWPHHLKNAFPAV